jgi:hypothetical protein
MAYLLQEGLQAASNCSVKKWLKAGKILLLCEETEENGILV